MADVGQSETSAEQAVRAWNKGRRLFGNGVALHIMGDFYAVTVHGEVRSIRSDPEQAIKDAHAWVAAVKKARR